MTRWATEGRIHLGVVFIRLRVLSVNQSGFYIYGVIVFISFVLPKMDYRVVSGVLAVVCLFLAAYVFVVGGPVKSVVVNNTVASPSGDFGAYYLYPLRCVNCNLNEPGQCDYCNSFYDERVMDLVSQDVGVPVQFYISDAVKWPGILVMSKGRVTLGDARKRINIAQTLCDFAGVKKSCEYFAGQMNGVRECVKSFGIDEKTLVYHTNTGKDCPACAKTGSVVEELKALNYDDNTKYAVFTADRAVSEKGKIITQCLGSYDNNPTVPQLICPGTYRDLTGEFTLSQAQEFADKCVEQRYA